MPRKSQNLSIEDILSISEIINKKDKSETDLIYLREALEFLPSIKKIFSHLDSKSIQQFLRNLNFKHVPELTCMIDLNDKSKPFFIILRGSAIQLDKLDNDYNEHMQSNVNNQYNMELSKLCESENNNQNTMEKKKVLLPRFSTNNCQVDNAETLLKSLIADSNSSNQITNILKTKGGSSPLQNCANFDEFINMEEKLLPSLDQSTILNNKKQGIPDPQSKESFIGLLFPDMRIMNTLHEGDHFGESQTQKNSSKGQIVALDACDLIFVNHSIYKETILNVFENEFRERNKILDRISLFKDLSHDYMMILNRDWNTIHLYRNNIIFEEQDPVDNVYIILEGEIEVAVLGTYEAFGEESIIESCSLPKRQLTATVLSAETELLAIPSNKLAYLLNHSNSKKILEEKYFNKLKWRKSLEKIYFKRNDYNNILPSLYNNNNSHSKSKQLEIMKEINQESDNNNDIKMIELSPHVKSRKKIMNNNNSYQHYPNKNGENLTLNHLDIINPLRTVLIFPDMISIIKNQKKNPQKDDDNRKSKISIKINHKMSPKKNTKFSNNTSLIICDESNKSKSSITYDNIDNMQIKTYNSINKKPSQNLLKHTNSMGQLDGTKKTPHSLGSVHSKNGILLPSLKFNDQPLVNGLKQKFGEFTKRDLESTDEAINLTNHKKNLSLDLSKIFTKNKNSALKVSTIRQLQNVGSTNHFIKNILIPRLTNQSVNH